MAKRSTKRPVRMSPKVDETFKIEMDIVEAIGGKFNQSAKDGR